MALAPGSNFTRFSTVVRDEEHFEKLFKLANEGIQFKFSTLFLASLTHSLSYTHLCDTYEWQGPSLTIKLQAVFVYVVLEVVVVVCMNVIPWSSELHTQQVQMEEEVNVLVLLQIFLGVPRLPFLGLPSPPTQSQWVQDDLLILVRQLLWFFFHSRHRWMQRRSWIEEDPCALFMCTFTTY